MLARLLFFTGDSLKKAIVLFLVLNRWLVVLAEVSNSTLNQNIPNTPNGECNKRDNLYNLEVQDCINGLVSSIGDQSNFDTASTFYANNFCNCTFSKTNIGDLNNSGTISNAFSHAIYNLRLQAALGCSSWKYLDVYEEAINVANWTCNGR